jgi:hypothetical protein
MNVANTTGKALPQPSDIGCCLKTYKKMFEMCQCGYNIAREPCGGLAVRILKKHPFAHRTHQQCLQEPVLSEHTIGSLIGWGKSSLPSLMDIRSEMTKGGQEQYQIGPLPRTRTRALIQKNGAVCPILVRFS